MEGLSMTLYLHIHALGEVFLAFYLLMCMIDACWWEAASFILISSKSLYSVFKHTFPLCYNIAAVLLTRLFYVCVFWSIILGRFWREGGTAAC